MILGVGSIGPPCRRLWGVSKSSPPVRGSMLPCVRGDRVADGLGCLIDMEPSQRKLLFVFVREALSHPGGLFTTTRRNPKTIQELRALGFIEPHEDSPTDTGYSAYFESFEPIEPPGEVQAWAERFRLTDIRWRRPSGVIKNQMPQQRGKAYPGLRTAFIGDRAEATTWFHELGHIVYPRIDKGQIRRLATVARGCCPVVAADSVSNALGPATRQPSAMDSGLYLNVNGKYCGLDLSGKDEDAIDDEIWATLFAEHCTGFGLPQAVRAVLEEVIAGLESRCG